MEFHMGVVGDHARQAYAQTLEPPRASRSSARPPATSCGCSSSRQDQESG
jgi:hypothetical protein